MFATIYENPQDNSKWCEVHTVNPSDASDYCVKKIDCGEAGGSILRADSDIVMGMFIIHATDLGFGVHMVLTGVPLQV